jgi:hypothetical protein
MAYWILEWPENRVGYVAFSDDATLVHELTDNRGNLIGAMNGRTYKPGFPTILSKGIDRARKHFHDKYVPLRNNFYSLPDCN